MVKYTVIWLFFYLPFSYGWETADYPVGMYSKKCLVDKPALICDPDRILSEPIRSRANKILQEISHTESCNCIDMKYCRNTTRGYTVGIAFVRSIDHPKMPNSPSTLRDFSEKVRIKWDLDHCNDDMFVAVCVECEEIRIIHGDWTKKRKIPEKVRSRMESQANQLLAFTNTSVVLNYLLNNYRKFIENTNRTPTVDMLVLPYKDLSTGVVTVMVLTCLLSVGWAVCVTYLLVLIVKRRKARNERQSNKTTSTDLNAETGTQRQYKSPLLEGGERNQLSKLELRRVPNNVDSTPVVQWHWRHDELMRKVPTSSTIAGIPSITSNGTLAGIDRIARRGFSFSASDTSRRPGFDLHRNGSLPNMDGKTRAEQEIMMNYLQSK